MEDRTHVAPDLREVVRGARKAQSHDKHVPAFLHGHRLVRAIIVTICLGVVCT
jgi:hypothetical protein